jgi:hypothetical protein
VQTQEALAAQVSTLTAQNSALQATISAPTATSAVTATPAATNTPVPPTVTATPARTPTPTKVVPTVTPTPGKIDLIAQNTSCYKTSIDSVYCIGEVVNQGQAEASEVRIAISLLDATGKTVATGSAGGFLPTVPILKPGEKTVYYALMDGEPAEWAEQRVQVQGKPVTASTRSSAYLDVNADGVTIGTNQYDWVVVSGQVVNTGTGTAKSVRVTAAVYDAEGKLVGVRDGYAKLEQIPAGGSAPFSIDFLNLEGEYPTVDVYISAQVVR